MSVLNTEYKDSYIGRIDTGPYAITFDCVLDDGGDAMDIVVKLLDSNDVETDITSSCTITGKNVYTSVAYGITYTVVLVRYPDLTQPYTFPFGTKFPSRTFEKALDRLLYLAQRLALESDQSLKVPLSESAPNRIPSVAERMSKFAFYDAAGQPGAASGMASVPVTAWAATLLDDADLATGKATLDMRVKPYLVAANDTPSSWKQGANYILSAGQDIGAAINALIDAGETYLMLAPGTFPFDTYISLSTSRNVDVRIVGSGRGRTILQQNTGSSAFLYAATGSGFDHRIEVENLTVLSSGKDVSSLTMAIFRADSTEVNSYVRNVEVLFTGCTSTVTRTICAFDYFNNIENAYVSLYSISDADIRPRLFQNCKNLEGCSISYVGLTASTGLNYGFYLCYDLHNCKITFSGLSTTGFLRGFQECYRLVMCQAIGDSSGNSSGVYGFMSCDYLDLCRAYKCIYRGFNSLNHAINCLADQCYVGFDSVQHGVNLRAVSCTNIGFVSLEFGSSCRAQSCGDDGFWTCQFLSSCAAYMNTGDGFSACNHITGSWSQSNTGYGFVGSKQCQQNYSISNTAGNVNTSYADQASNAMANTAAGGYNRIS